MPKDENLDGSESDASDKECENDSESLADDNVIDTVLQAINISDLQCSGYSAVPTCPTGRPLPSPSLSPIYIDSNAPDESARSQDASNS